MSIQKQITESVSIETFNGNESIFININGTIGALTLEESTLFQEIFKLAIREKIYEY